MFLFQYKKVQQQHSSLSVQFCVEYNELRSSILWEPTLEHIYIYGIYSLTVGLININEV